MEEVVRTHGVHSGEVKKSKLWIWILLFAIVVVAVVVLVFMLDSDEVDIEPVNDSKDGDVSLDADELLDRKGAKEEAARSGAQCDSDVYNCANFSSHDEAQAVFEFCGGLGNDVHRLDGDKDGIACGALK